jgi:hypothetical protein
METIPGQNTTSISTIGYDLGEALQNIAAKFNYKLEMINETQYRMDVALKLKDGSFRYQFVYIWISKGFAKGKDVIYMNSRCGTYTPMLNLYNVMKEASWGVYSMVTITTDKSKDGVPCETVIVQASPIAEYTSPELLNEIIFEVASNADIIEEKFFGGDHN